MLDIRRARILDASTQAHLVLDSNPLHSTDDHIARFAPPSGNDGLSAETNTASRRGAEVAEVGRAVLVPTAPSAPLRESFSMSNLHFALDVDHGRGTN